MPTGVYARRPEEVRFWEKVDRKGADDCWHWTAVTAGGGYGYFTTTRKHLLAHRFAYEQMVGPIPEGLQLDHLCHGRDRTCVGGDTCRHRRCVNPAHLEPVTLRTNLLRGLGPSALHAKKTACPAGHPYDEANTRITRGERNCRECCRIRDRLRVRDPQVAHRAYLRRKNQGVKR